VKSIKRFSSDHKKAIFIDGITTFYSWEIVMHTRVFCLCILGTLMPFQAHGMQSAMRQRPNQKNTQRVRQAVRFAERPVLVPIQVTVLPVSTFQEIEDNQYRKAVSLCAISFFVTALGVITLIIKRFDGNRITL
jgi:hypothetical protein